MGLEGSYRRVISLTRLPHHSPLSTSSYLFVNVQDILFGILFELFVTTSMSCYVKSPLYGTGHISSL